LKRCADNHAEGGSRIHVQRTYAVEEVPAALADVASGTLGKLAITVA
jgi:hypothetical protein